MSRFSIERTSKKYLQIKALAEFKGKLIITLALERLIDKNEDAPIHDEDQAWEDLKTFLKHRIT